MCAGFPVVASGICPVTLDIHAAVVAGAGQGDLMATGVDSDTCRPPRAVMVREGTPSMSLFIHKKDVSTDRSLCPGLTLVSARRGEGG